MALHDPTCSSVEREWRRCVRVKARIKSADGWRDASILNVSSRGLMIHSACASGPGERIELRGGDQVIVARVVWRKGARAGLKTDYVLPVMDILSLTEKPASMGQCNPEPRFACRRKLSHEAEPCDRWPKLLELASVAGMGALVVAVIVTTVTATILEQLGAIESALNG